MPIINHNNKSVCVVCKGCQEVWPTSFSSLFSIIHVIFLATNFNYVKLVKYRVTECSQNITTDTQCRFRLLTPLKPQSGAVEIEYCGVFSCKCFAFFYASNLTRLQFVTILLGFFLFQQHIGN